MASRSLGPCQLNLSQADEFQNQSVLRCRRYGLPFRHRLVAEATKCAARDAVAVDIKQIVNRSVS